LRSDGVKGLFRAARRDRAPWDGSLNWLTGKLYEPWRWLRKWESYHDVNRRVVHTPSWGLDARSNDYLDFRLSANRFSPRMKVRLSAPWAWRSGMDFGLSGRKLHTNEAIEDIQIMTTPR